MKVRCEIVIDADQDTTWRIFDDPDNMQHWQPTLESFTRKSGEPGQPGTVSELVYDENGRKILLIETVTERREPHFMAAIYESAMGKAVIVNHFEAVDEKRTRWVMYANHTFKGLYRLPGLIIRGTIRARNQQLMNNLRLLAETRQAEQAG